MKILLIILGLCLLLNVLLLTYPVRLAVELDRQRAAVYWLPYIARRVCLWQREFAPSKLIAALSEGDWAKAADLLLDGRAERREKSTLEKERERDRLSWTSIRAVIVGGLAALRVRKFRLYVAVGGDPFYAAMLAGSLSAVLSAALARLSAAVAAWQGGAQCIDVAMLSPDSRFADSRLNLSAEMSVCAGTALWEILRRMGRNVSRK